MTEQNKVTMWTAQTDRVLKTLEEDKVYYVKKRYVDAKYQETAWSFRIAYQFLADEMAARIPQPSGAESPVWLYWDPGWAMSGPGDHLMKLEIPWEEVLLFDLRKWNRILNLSFVGTAKEQAEFEKELDRQGISAASEVFEKPFYPMLKQKIMKSWKNLFDESTFEEKYVQGAVWYLKKEWICRE